MKIMKRLVCVVLLCSGVASVSLGNANELISDGSFESLAGMDPASNSAPWAVDGEGGAWSVTTSAHALINQPTGMSEFSPHSGAQAVCFNWNGDPSIVYQTMTNAVFDSSKTYNGSFWMYTYDNQNPTATGETKLNFVLVVSNDGGANWTWLRTFVAGASNTVLNTWQQFSGTFDGAAYSQYDGWDMQIRVAKPWADGGMEYAIAIDDVSVEAVAPVVELIGDGGFESLVGDEPSSNSAPWAVDEGGSAWSVTTSAHALNNQPTGLSGFSPHGGTQAVCFNWNGAPGYVYQTITSAVFDSSKTYDGSFWMYTYDNEKTNAGETTLNFVLVVSNDGGANWTWLRTLAAGASNTVLNTWQQFSGTVDGSAYSQYDGWEMQIRVAKPWVDGGMEYAMAIDDVSLTTTADPEPEPDAAEFVGISSVSSTVMKVEVDSNNPELFYLKAAQELTTNTAWNVIGQSTNGLDPFIETNLSYSAASGSNIIIYVKADQNKKFFSLDKVQ